jgi:hypothetical protein
VIGIGVLAVLVPWGLELIGLLPPSYEFRGDYMLVMARMHYFSPGATLLFLFFVGLGHIISISILMGRLNEARLSAIQRAHKQTKPGSKYPVHDWASHPCDALRYGAVGVFPTLVPSGFDKRNLNQKRRMASRTSRAPRGSKPGSGFGGIRDTEW